MAKVNPIIQWWMTPKLPKVHIFISPEKKPKGVYQIVRVYSRTWLIHPIKRRIAKYYLQLLQRFFGLKVIGITGSVGKTTVKEMVVAILRNQGETIASYKNIDPVYNIPTTILKCRPSTKFLVLEFGVEFPGEMKFYHWLARPVIGVITNIYPTHIQFFKNIEGVAKEKASLVRVLPKDGFAILNIDNKHTKSFARKTKAEIVWFGKKGDIKAENSMLNESLKMKFTLSIKRDKIDVQLPVASRQFVLNALAAASVGHVLEINLEQIKNGLESYNKPGHRMNIVKLSSGALLLDDSYNNNPEATKAAMETLDAIAGRRKKVVVFGDMLELGKQEVSYHRDAGRLILSYGIDYFLGVGRLSKITAEEIAKTLEKRRVFWVQKESQVDRLLKPHLRKSTAVLIKGSRSIGLDKLVSRLLP